MSITDELREYVSHYSVAGSTKDKLLTAIADRIDIAHKHAIGYVDDHDPEIMAENGWIRLPKDADGEYIHIGDLMVYADGNTCPLPVVALVPPAIFLTDDGPRYADMCRHHHEPTVEDVLREFYSRYCTTKPKEEDDAILAEYAAKLRLAGDGA